MGVRLLVYLLNESNVQDVAELEDVSLQLEGAACHTHHLQPVTVTDFLQEENVESRITNQNVCVISHTTDVVADIAICSSNFTFQHNLTQLLLLLHSLYYYFQYYFRFDHHFLQNYHFYFIIMLLYNNATIILLLLLILLQFLLINKYIS